MKAVLSNVGVLLGAFAFILSIAFLGPRLTPRGSADSPDEPASTVVTTTAAPADVDGGQAAHPVEAPFAEARLELVGVAHGDTLNVRDTPDGTIIGQLKFSQTSTHAYELSLHAPGDPANLGPAIIELKRDGVVALGSSRRPVSTVWHKVTLGGIEGWVSDHYVGQSAQTGAPDDLSRRLAVAIGTLRAVSSVADLNERATDALSQIDPERRVTMVGAEWGGPEQSVTFDVIAWVAAIDDDPDDYRRPVRGHRVVVSLRAHGDWKRLGAVEPGAPYTIERVTVYPICAATAEVALNGSCIA